MAQQIKITQTSNADMNIGVPKNLTAVEWLYKLSKQRELDKFDLEQAKAMEKEQISEAYRQSVEEDVWNNPLRTGDEYYDEKYNSSK
jgi:threonine synthase